jgi:glycosyltransferase involved in cell wall biosynthesis
MAPPSVSFLGYRNDIVNILNRSDISVLPSVSEGVSNSLLEAGACGMACVASNVGGSPEIIDDGENGFLFPSKDSGALADRLIQLCENSGLRAMFGKNLRRKVEQQFDIEPVITKLEYVAKSVVS